MPNSKKENFFLKNVFSIIGLCLTIGGFIVGYTKLQMTVEGLKNNDVNKEMVREITKELIKDNNALLQKDILYIQEDIKKINANIGRLYQKTNLIK